MKNYSKQVVIPKFFKSKHGFIRTPQTKKCNFKVYDLSDEESFCNSGVPFLFNVHTRSYAKANRNVEHTINRSFLHQGRDISLRKRENLALTNADETLFGDRQVYSKKSYFRNIGMPKLISNNCIKLENKEMLGQTYCNSTVCCKSKYHLPRKFGKENCNEEMLNRFVDSHKMEGNKKPMIERFNNSQLNTCNDFTYDDFDEIIRHSNKSADIRRPRNKRKRLRQTCQSQSSFSIINEGHFFERRVQRSHSLCGNKGVISHGINFGDAVVPLTPKRRLKKNHNYEELLDSFSKENIDGKDFYESPTENEVDKYAYDDQESLIDKPVDSISLPEEKILTIYEKLLSKEGINSASILYKNKSFVAPPEKEISCIVSGVLNKFHDYANSDDVQNNDIKQPINVPVIKSGDKFDSDAQVASVEMNLNVQFYDPVEVLQTKAHYSHKTSEAHFYPAEGETDRTNHCILLEEPNVELLTKNISNQQSVIILKDTCISSKEEVDVNAKNNFEEVILASACHGDKVSNDHKKRKNKKRKTCYSKKRKKTKAQKKSHQSHFYKIHSKVELPVYENEKLMRKDTLINVEGNPENLKLTQNISMVLAPETESFDTGATRLVADKCIPHCQSVAGSESRASPVLQEQLSPQANQDILICKDISGSVCNEISNIDLNFEGSETVCVTNSGKSKVTKNKRKGQKKSEMKVENDGVVEQESTENCEVNFMSAESLLVIGAPASTNSENNSKLEKNKPEGLEGIKQPGSILDMRDSPILTKRTIVNDNSLGLSKTNCLQTLVSSELCFDDVEMNYENIEDTKHTKKVRKSRGKMKLKNYYRKKHKKKRTVEKDVKRSKVTGACKFVQESQENKLSELFDTCNTDPASVSECLQLNTGNSINTKESTLLMVKSDFVETSSDFTFKHSKFPSNCQISEKNVDEIASADVATNNSFECKLPTNFIETPKVELRLISSSPTNDVSLNVPDKEISSLKICKGSCSFIPLRSLVGQNPIDFKALLSHFPSDDVTIGSPSRDVLVVEKMAVPRASNSLTSPQEIVEINAAILNIPDSPIHDLRLKSSVSKLICLPQDVTTKSNISQIADVNQISQKRRRVSFAGFTVVNIIDDQQGYSRRARQYKGIADEVGFLDTSVTKDISSDKTKTKGILKKVSKSHCLIDNNLSNDVENCKHLTPAISPKKGRDVKSSQSFIKGILVEDVGIRSQLLRSFIGQHDDYSESLFSRKSPMSLQRNSMKTLYCNEGLSSGSQGSELSDEGHCIDNESPMSGVESLYRGWLSPSHIQAS